MSLLWLTTIFLFSYGVLFVHLAIAVLVIKKKKYIHYVSAALLADFGTMCVAGGLYCYSDRAGVAVNAAVFVPMVLLAPIGAAFVVDCFGARLSARRLMLALKAGTVAALALGAVLVAAGALWRFVFAVAYGWLFVAYTAIAAFEARELRPLRAMPTGLRTFFVLFLIDIILIGAMFAFQLMDYFPGLNILWMILILSVFATTLIAFRSPDTYRLIESQAAKIRYERSRLMNVSVDRTIAEMKRLMADEELYRDSDLSLEDLAERLRMNAPQLSELLNLHVGLTFPVYVNGFRTEFAKRCLLSEPKDSILDIAFECGFNSKSTFNAAFLKATGLTPSEYRKRVLPPRP